MEESIENLPKYVLIIGLTFLVLATIVFINEKYGNSILQDDGLGSSNFTYTTSQTISPIGEGITSSSFSRLNDTWLSCDGNNDYNKIIPNSNDTISFWYNSSTSVGWRFVVNVLGTKYTDGVEVAPDEYPVYWDDGDSAYYFCMTDDSTYWEGEIDNIKTFDGQLSADRINEIYLEGRI